MFSKAPVRIPSGSRPPRQTDELTKASRKGLGLCSSLDQHQLLEYNEKSSVAAAWL